MIAIILMIISYILAMVYGSKMIKRTYTLKLGHAAPPDSTN